MFISKVSDHFKMKLKFFISILFCTTISLADGQKDSEVLISTQETKIKKDGSSVETYEIVEKVLTEAGRTKLSIFKINFIKSETKFKLIKAFTLNGIKKSIIAPSSVKIRNADQAKTGISDTMEAVISYNNIQIGSEVHTRYELSKISVFSPPNPSELYENQLLDTLNKSWGASKSSHGLPMVWQRKAFVATLSHQSSAEGESLVMQIEKY